MQPRTGGPAAAAPAAGAGGRSTAAAPAVGGALAAGSSRRVLWATRDLPPLGPDVAGDLPRYREWAQGREAARLADAVHRPGASGPELALLLVVRDPDPSWLRGCLRSVGAQTSTRWALSVVGIGPLHPVARSVLDAELALLPPGRTHLRWVPGATSDADAASAALAACAGPAFSVLGQHDQLAPDAVAQMAAGLDGADVAYGDEDGLGDDGLAVDPRLKPGWSPELLLSTPYVGRPVALRREVVAATGGLRSLAGGDWEHDLLLRVTERTDRVAHIPEVLCHRYCGAGAGPTTGAGAGPTTGAGGGPTTGARAVRAALERRGIDATVVPGPLPESWSVRRRLAGRPRVSAVVPFRDAAPLLRACVDSVTSTAAGDGVDLHLLLVDNGSTEPETLTLLDRLEGRHDVTVLRDARPFNWAALNNAAARAATGELLLFLNNDVEARRPGWLGALAAQALRPEVGAVGARLCYPGGRVQHAGVVLGLGGAAGHVLAGLPGDRPGYLGMAVLARDCAAVTGACMATRRGVFEELGGFDEQLGLDLNDVDYCIRARDRGLHVLYEPLAELVHHESPSRGTSGSPADQARFLDRWEDLVVAGDPYLNPQLTRADCSAALRQPGEEGEWREWRSTLTR